MLFSISELFLKALWLIHFRLPKKKHFLNSVKNKKTKKKKNTSFPATTFKSTAFFAMSVKLKNRAIGLQKLRKINRGSQSVVFGMFLKRNLSSYCCT